MKNNVDDEETFLGRRSILKGVGALAGLSAVSAVFGFPNLWAQACGEEDISIAPLRKRAARRGLIYGAATGCKFLTGDKEFAAHFADECGILVPEWELKWKALRPTSDSFNFASGDCLAQFARKNNMLFRGHTLVWGDDLPVWFQRAVHSQNAKRILLEHITTVVGHYAGRIHSWDVVNEAIAPWERLPDGMRNSPWLRLLGPEYIDIAFRAAAVADPNALLVLNQNYLEYDSIGSEECRVATLNLLKHLKSIGTPVHALGIQGHLSSEPEDGKFNPKVFKTFLRDVAGLDLKILITELDVMDGDLPQDVDLHDRLVAEMYEEFLVAALAEPAVIGVLTWGLSDKYSRLAEVGPRKDKAAVRPLPLDEKFNRKLAWSALARAFDNAPVRSVALDHPLC